MQHTLFLDRFRKYSWIILWVVSIIQCIFWPYWANIFAIGTILISWKLVTHLLLRTYVIKNFSFSFFLILGFSLTQYFLPPIFTLLEGKPVIYNLDVPYQVFTHSILVLIVILCAHLFYRFNANSLISKFRSLLKKSNLFKPPTDIQVWLMGFMGLGAMFYVYFYAPSANVEIAGPVDKLIQGLVPFSYAPFFLPLGKLYGRRQKIPKSVFIQLGLFFLILLVLSLGRNSRGAFMFGFTAIGFGYLIGLFLGQFSSAIISWKNILIAVAGIWLITGPLVDLGTSMVIVRAERGDISRAELLWRTLDVYQNEQELQRYREIGNQQLSPSAFGWDESYLENIFLARFSNLKFSDNSLELASNMGYRDSEMFDFTTDRFLSTFPRPLLSFFDIDANKDRVNSMSFGDFLYANAGGPSSALGGKRVGHFMGTGMASFGWWYLVILGAGMIPLFFLIDSLSLIVTSENTVKVIFSLAGLISITSFFMFLPTESVANIYAFLVRGWLQLIFLYWVVFHITKIITFLKLN